MAAPHSAAGLSDLSFERSLYEAGIRMVIGMDEVGRGCIAGPVGVGAACFDLEALLAAQVPAGLRDSKKLSASRREKIAAEVRDYAAGSTVAYASAGEIDQLGMTLALCLAGRRALAALPPADLVMLDGSFDWLSADLTLDAAAAFGPAAGVAIPPVQMFVKGDDTYVPIAAASVLAKVDRDALMTQLAQQFPHYGWERNAGYPTPAHKSAVARHGAAIWHRKSFKL